MATITANIAAALDAVSAEIPAKPSFLRRLGQAMIESRRRQAEIETRRVLALRGEPLDRQDYALLPFSGE